MTEMRDIRELAGDTEAYRAELQRRWTGLLSYRYIGRSHSSMNLGPVDNTVRIRHDMRNEAGGIMVAPLAISSPEGCQTDLVAVPNPVISSVQILDPGIDVQTIEVLGSGLVHQGRTMGYGRCLIVDAQDHDRVIVFIEGQGASIGKPPEGLERMDVDDSAIVVEDSPDLPPLWQVFGASRVATTATGRFPNCGRISRLPTPRSTSDPSMSCSRRPPSTSRPAWPALGDSRCSSWHVMFMARGKTGPFRVEGTAHGVPEGRVGVRMLLHDEGNGDRAVTSAAASLSVVD